MESNWDMTGDDNKWTCTRRGEGKGEKKLYWLSISLPFLPSFCSMISSFKDILECLPWKGICVRDHCLLSLLIGFIDFSSRLQLTSASAATKTHETAFRVVDHHSASRHQPKAGAIQGSPSKQSSATSRVTPKGPLPPVNTRRKTSQIDVSDFLVQSSQDTKIVPSSRTLSRSAIKEGRKTISEIVKDSKEIKPLGSISKPVSHHKETRTSSPSHGATSLDYASGSASLRRSRIPEDSSNIRYPLDLSTGSGGFRRLRGMDNRVPTPEGRRSGLLVSMDHTFFYHSCCKSIF